MSVFSRSKYIWSERKSPSRNAFVSFERSLECSPADTGLAFDQVWIHLFADSRFRLWVNGHFVAYGPGRFVTQYPEYDSYDIASKLKPGTNLIRVEVNFYGCSSYQTMPDGQPGFIAAGGTSDGNVDFATPGNWQARVHHAWKSHAPAFSFAQNPAEICDTRILVQELADPTLLTPIKTLRAEEKPWGELKPRFVPYPDYKPYSPTRIEATGILQASMTLGFQTVNQAFSKGLGNPLSRGFATWIYSPAKQTITIGCFWSDLYLNGHLVEISKETVLGNHEEAELLLNEGWNLLSGQFELLGAAWAYLLRFPDGGGLSAHAVPDRACIEAFGLSSVSSDPIVLPECPVESDLYELPDGWTLNDGSVQALTPARVIAWDVFDSDTVAHDLDFKQLSEFSEYTADQACWSFSFAREFYGHPVIEVEAPEGAILDIAYDDWKRSDGCVNLYGANPFTDAADRFILKGGRQRIEVLNPRGGIYLQITLRHPDEKCVGSLKLVDVYIQRRTTINESDMVGGFKSDDPDFDYAWDAAVNSLAASTDESYSDCPWRERGAYIGDSLVSIALNSIVTSDFTISHRSFKIFGQAALPDGQLACCAPSWLRLPHEDFTYIWILGIQDLWSKEGDVQIVKDTWQYLLNIWKAPWETHASGLWNANDRRLFLDWGVEVSDRIGQANATINILRYAALRASANLACVLHLDKEMHQFNQEADQVKAALIEHLWDEQLGCFRPSFDHEGPALHANILALCFDVGPAERLLAYLEPRLRKNLKQGLEQGQGSGHAELYFLYYVLPKLGELGAIDLAEQLVVDHYGYLRELGCQTLNECFCRAHLRMGSACHVWSSVGAIYAHRYVLGLRQVEPGNPDRWLLDPRVSERFSSVEGVLPHKDGPIHVSWQRNASGAKVALVQAPENVHVELAEGVVYSAEMVS